MMYNADYTIRLITLMNDPIAKAELDKALSDYPMYTKNPHPEYISTREQLNEKLLNHYKYREIGSETPGRFLDDLRTVMHEIMPYYVQLYKSHDIMNQLDDPFGNVDIVETFEETTTGNVRGNTTGENKSDTKENTSSSTNGTSETSSDITTAGKNVKSGTPQDSLTITAKNIDSVEYADEVNWDKNESNSTGTSNDNTNTTGENKTTNETTITTDTESESTGTTQHTFTKKGNQGVNTYAHDMKELRETFLNIDEMIIENKKIQELFMQIY